MTVDIDVFEREEHAMVFRVLRTALNPHGALEDREREFLDTYAHIVGRRPARAEPIDAIEVSLAGARKSKRLVQLAALAALVTHPVRPASVAYVAALAKRLYVRDSVVEVLQALQNRRHRRVRFLAMRRALRSLLGEAFRAEGVRGVLQFLGAMFLGLAANARRLWDFKRLGLLPEGTLGRTYWVHMTERGFGFPGDPKGIPGPVAYHDVAHVLAGHDTTPLGEIQQGCFQAGNRRDDGFFFAQFVILQFHHGVVVTPMSPAFHGNYHPAKVLWAIHRGARCPVDMTSGWDFWPLMRLPLAEARARCGLLPRLQPN
jgi:hypothetical protein